MPKKDGGLG